MMSMVTAKSVHPSGGTGYTSRGLHTSKNSSQFFRQQIRVSGFRYSALDQRNKIISPAREERIVEIYENTFDAPLPLVLLGESQSLWYPTLIYNFGGASATPWVKALSSKFAKPDWKNEKSEVQTMDMVEELALSEPERLKVGSVLIEANWGIAENDAFARGAIDGRKQFHVASSALKLSKLSDEALWNDTLKCPSVLAHELVTAVEYGYKWWQHTAAALGIVLVPPAESHAPQVDFDKLLGYRATLTLADIRKFVEKAEKSTLVFTMKSQTSGSEAPVAENQTQGAEE